MSETAQEGYTPLPHWFTTNMPHWHPAVTLVALVIARHTYGWQKESDRISISQFEKETGLCRRGVQEAIKKGRACGLIVRTGEGQNLSYQLCYSVSQEPCYSVASEDSEPYHSVAQSETQEDTPRATEYHDTVSLSSTEPCYSVATQKKERNKERDHASIESMRPQIEPPAPPPSQDPVVIYLKATGLHSVSKSERDRIVAAITDYFEVWRLVCEFWIEQGYRPRNLDGLFDRFEQDREAQQFVDRIEAETARQRLEPEPQDTRKTGDARLEERMFIYDAARLPYPPDVRAYIAAKQARQQAQAA